MKRREFIKTSAAASALLGLSCAATREQTGSETGAVNSREYYELRVYRLRSGSGRDLLDAYLSQALIPALNRLGVRTVGVFVQQERAGAAGATEVRDESSIMVLIPFPSIESFASAGARLNADPAYQSAGADYLNSPKTTPAFERIDSWLLLAFAGMSKAELPGYCQKRSPRMFELRTYESHSEPKALKKVDMFNDGEIQLMRDVGLGPIFYGQALIGSNLPHLTYLLSAEDQAAHAKHWDAFRQHPIWDKMKNDPQYADTVSKITNRFLVPASYSQI